MTKEKLNPNQIKIIEELKKDPKLSHWKLSIKLNINERNVQKNMQILKLMPYTFSHGCVYKFFPFSSYTPRNNPCL